jgi:hypothetical protein
MMGHMVEREPSLPQTPAELRAVAEDALRPLGQERIRLITRLEEIDKELKPLVGKALEAEVSERRIGQLTALARGTVRSWGRKTDTSTSTDTSKESAA